MARDLHRHLQQQVQEPNPAQHFAGVYELVEVYDGKSRDFQSGDHELHELYEIIIMDGGQIWFSDIDKIFKKNKGTFVLDVVDEEETEWGTLLDTAWLAQDELIIKEIQYYWNEDEWDYKIVQINRIHEFLGEYLIVIDCNDCPTEPAIQKKYLRVK